MSESTPISQSTPITLGLVASVVALAFTAGIGWQRLGNLEESDILTQEMLKETRDIAIDNKHRLDRMEKN